MPRRLRLDHLGTPKILTDEEGLIVWKSDLGPYGEEMLGEFQVTSNFKASLRFPGQYADSESGLNYNYFRDYDPSTGRYIQSDPIGLSGGLNTYGYALGNPVNYSDPRGLFVPQLAGGVLGFAVGFGMEFMSEDGDFFSALGQGAVAGAAGALSGGATLIPALAVAFSASSATEVYKSVRDCDDLSQVNFYNIAGSTLSAYGGGKIGETMIKGMLQKDLFRESLKVKSFKDHSIPSYLYNPKILGIGVGAGTAAENLMAPGISTGLERLSGEF